MNRKKTIDNLLCPSVYNKGYLGIGNYTVSLKGKHTKIYKTWKGMLERCYSSAFHLNNPSYEDCFVCEEWLNFQNFAKWFEENYIEGFELDKDILVKGNREYGPNTCCFVSFYINTLILKCKKSRGDLPIGVHKHGSNFRTRLNIGNKQIKQLGTYSTPEKAFDAYKTAKELQIRQAADGVKDVIKKIVYDALYNYKIEITD
jgi:hypothetical protein